MTGGGGVWQNPNVTAMQKIHRLWGRHPECSELPRRNPGGALRRRGAQDAGPARRGVPARARASAARGAAAAREVLNLSFSLNIYIYSIQYTVYSIQYTVYSIQYTVYSIHRIYNCSYL